MYCINCGVKMADGKRECPLCKTKVYHPDFLEMKAENQYPEKKYPKKEMRSKFWQAVLTFAAVISVFTVVLCDLQINGAVTWSGYVMGAVLLAYCWFVLPMWFHKPNPVIFVPCGFLGATLYLFYLDVVLKGSWFFTFVLPMMIALCIIVSSVVTVARYVRRGRLFLFGGAFLAFGAAMLLCEFLMTLTFESVNYWGWSLYPLVVFGLLGGFLIFLGICRPARESMERKFFI